MRHEFEYLNYSESERLAMLENIAAELERSLGVPETRRGAAEGRRGAAEGRHRAAEVRHDAAEPLYWATISGRHRPAGDLPGYGDDAAGDDDYDDDDSVEYDEDLPEYDVPASAAPGPAGRHGRDERTEVLINRGRRDARRPRRARWLKHWRAIGVALAVVAVGSFVLTLVLPGPGGTWPATVAQVKSEITVACQNPNVVSEPSQVNFACDKTTSQVLWVFSLLTSGDNPAFTDPDNGRKGLEPITPAQGGDVAFSLNLHHPYDPANPTDSLEVAARAINDIIGGATLTGSSGAPVVQPGLESSPANCLRYTGSSAMVTKQGFPAICAAPVSTASGQAALVSDVFEQWMVGTPPRVAQEAGLLFENADNPGDSRVQAILNSLPDSGL